MQTPAARAGPLLASREHQRSDLRRWLGANQARLVHTLPSRVIPHTANECRFCSFLSATVFALLSVTLAPHTALKYSAAVLGAGPECREAVGALRADRALSRLWRAVALGRLL